MARRSTPTTSQWLGAAALASGCVAMVGWVADVPALRSVLPGLVAMKVNTALCLMLAGLSLWLQGGAEPRRMPLARAAAAIVTVLGALTLGEHLFGWQLGIDELLFRESNEAIGTSSPGRMAFTTAWAFLALGPTLLCLRVPRRWAGWVAQVLAVPAAALGLLTVVGYLLEGPRLYSVGLWAAMALHTALAVMALGLGALLAQPDSALACIARDRGTGGAVGRLLLPLSVLAPAVSSWLWLRGQRLGLLPIDMGLAILSVVCSAAFALGATWLACWLQRAERSREVAEQALRESERTMRELMHHARCSLWSGEVTAVPGGGDSDHMPDVYTWIIRSQPDEAPNQDIVPLDVVRPFSYTTMLHLSVPDDERAAKDAVGLEALRSGASHYGQEFRCLDRDGSTRWIHEAVTLQPIEPGRWHVFGVWLDVTERRQAMQALAEREAGLRELMRHARCALWSGFVEIRGSGAEQHFAWAINPQPDEQAAQALVPLEVAPGSTYIFALHEHVPLTHQQAKGAVGEAAVLGGDSHYSQEYPCIDRHGAVHWLHEEVSLQPDGPNRYKLAGVWVDITELRVALASLAEAEQFSRATLDALPAHICVLDELGVILTVNQAWRDFAKANPPVLSNVCEGANYLAVCDAAQGDDADQASAFAAGVRDVLAGRVAAFGMEYGCHSPDEQRWFIGRATRFAGLGPLRVVVSHANITDRVRAESERADLEQQVRAQQRLEAVGTLAGGVAHEINNPIMGVGNYAQLILDTLPADCEQATYAGEILRETDRIATIVRNLLAFSRQGRQSYSTARMADIVNDTLSLTHSVLRHDQVALQVDVPDDLPSLECRSQQIQQVLMNLVTNARDALNERYPEAHEGKIIWVTCRPLEQDGEAWLRLTVEDHGSGIAAAVGARMWDPFYTTKPRDKGTGLGLAISHGIVVEHHGRLWYESEEGQWTRFHVDLPLNQGATP